MLKFLQQIFNKESAIDGQYLGLALSPNGIELSHICLNSTQKMQLLQNDFSACEAPSAFKKEQLLPFIEQYHLNHIPTYITLSSEYYQLMLVDAPEVDDDELQEAVKWRVKDLISEELDDVIVDAFRLASDAYRGRMNMIYAAITNKKMVLDLVELINECELDLRSISINELSACGYTQFIPDIDDAGVALVTLNEHDGVINLTENGQLYLSRSISMGLKELGLTAHSEQEDKTTLDFTLNDSLELADNVDESGPIEACILEEEFKTVDINLIENLALDIQRSLDYYESQLGKSAIQKIFFLPTSDISCILSDLNERLPCRVEQLLISDIIDSEESLLNKPVVFSLGAALSASAAAINQAENMGASHA